MKRVSVLIGFEVRLRPWSKIFSKDFQDGQAFGDSAHPVHKLNQGGGMARTRGACHASLDAVESVHAEMFFTAGDDPIGSGRESGWNDSESQ